MVSIFIEDSKNGKDANFLHCLICKLFTDELPNYDIESIGGYTNLKLALPKFQENDDRKIKNIIIFDADDLSNGGSYKSRRAELESQLKEMNVNYDLFLLPNNSDDGCFETLYEKIVNPEHLRIIDCFDNYENCIAQYKTKSGSLIYKTPEQKSKMYAYISSMPLNYKQHKTLSKNWMFDNSEFWDLDNDYLLPLKEFLIKNINA